MINPLIISLTDKGFTINQIARQMKIREATLRKEIKNFPEIEKKLFDNGQRRKVKGGNHNEVCTPN